jgi:hypothetical protein
MVIIGSMENLSVLSVSFILLLLTVFVCLFVLSLNKHKVLVELGGHDAPKPFGATYFSLIISLSN